jgi:hypothetical protein
LERVEILHEYQCCSLHQWETLPGVLLHGVFLSEQAQYRIPPFFIQRQPGQHSVNAPTNKTSEAALIINIAVADYSCIIQQMYLSKVAQ